MTDTNDSNETKIAVLQTQMNNIEQKLDKGFEDMNKKLDEFIKNTNTTMVTQDQFWPVKTIVYSGAGFILISVLGAIIYYAIHYHQ
jgi:hypothetical protein